MFRTKRVYEPPTPDDGCRILVERLWPRGVTKDRAAIELWLKDISPSPQLRQWFGHDPAKWPEFQQRYRQELEQQPAAVDLLREKERRDGTVTLVYAARDEQRNSAVLLKAFLEGAARG